MLEKKLSSSKIMVICFRLFKDNVLYLLEFFLILCLFILKHLQHTFFVQLLFFLLFCDFYFLWWFPIYQAMNILLGVNYFRLGFDLVSKSLKFLLYSDFASFSKLSTLNVSFNLS
jgi:hypothetical protein